MNQKKKSYTKNSNIFKILLSFTASILFFTACQPQITEDRLKINPEMALPVAVTATLENSNSCYDETDPFAAIIAAYLELEQSNYTSYNENILSDVLIASSYGSTYNFGWDNLPKLSYAFYDINNNGIDELIIGAEQCISGIYALQDGSAVSILQVQERYYLSLLFNEEDNIIIEHAYGRMDYAEECFYTIDDSGQLVIVDVLHTNGLKYAENDDIITDDSFLDYSRSRSVDGIEHEITEEEYCRILKKYGSGGYYPDDNSCERRYLDITWIPLYSYENNSITN